jgi:hypothetical protein
MIRPGDRIDSLFDEGAGMASTALSVRTGLKSTFQVMLNPGYVIRELFASVPLPFAFSVSGLAFTLFFLQTGLDLWRVGAKSPAGVVGLAFLGILYGTAGVALVAAFAWAVSRPLRGACDLEWTLRAFALSYSPALIYASLGLFFNLAFGWHTAIAFGATGVLWALAPLIMVSREMLGGRLWAGIVMSTICGGLILVGWALITA